jgi:hypothetical protein
MCEDVGAGGMRRWQMPIALGLFYLYHLVYYLYDWATRWFIIEIIRYAIRIMLAAAAVPVIALAILVSPLVISVALILFFLGRDPWDYIDGPINQRCQR